MSRASLRLFDKIGQPHKTKNNTSTWRKKVAERPSKGGKNPSHKKNVAKRPPHREKSSRKPLNGEKGPPKGENRSKRALK